MNPYARFGFVVVNVIAGTCEPGDRELFFGPLHPKDIFVEVPATMHMAQLMRHLGIYESAKEAKQRGWTMPIPDGFSDWLEIGKKGHRVTILKAKEQEE